MAAKTFSRQGGFLKFVEVGVVIKYYNLNLLTERVSGDFVEFPDGNSYAYNDPELTNVFASAEAFADQVGTWKNEAQAGGGAGAVDSVFGRTGAVVAQSGDYGSDKITNQSGVSGATVSDALDNIEQGIPAWAQYSDTVYTTSNRLSITGGAPSVNIPNNAGSVINTFMPPGVEFYDGVSGLITPQTVGEVYDARINFKAESTTNQNYLRIQLDIGGAQGVILEKVIDFPRGAGIEHSFSSTNLFYALGTFISNGGQLKIFADDNAEIWDISYVIARSSVGDLDLPDAPSDGDYYGRINGNWGIIPTGGGATILSADETILESSWSGNTDYEYSVNIPGAQVGDFCLINPDEDVFANINTAGTVWDGYAYCGSVNTVTVVCRITSFINIPASSIFTVKVIQ